MKAVNLLFIGLVIFVSGSSLPAYGGSGPHEESDSSRQATEQHDTYLASGENQHNEDPKAPTGDNVMAGFDEFPNLHPLLVHFPIVLLILSACLALVNVYFLKKELDWVLTFTTGSAALGAYAAGRWFHPHGHDLPAHIQAVLDQHDLYAEWTIWLSIAAFILQLLSHFVLKQKRWAVGMVTLVLLGAAYTVSMAGHYGSQMVYIEGVGPQGKYLESEGGGHTH